MNRMQKICLALVCALALVVLPLSYAAWAQSTSPSTTQQDQNNSNATQNPDQDNPNQNLNNDQGTSNPNYNADQDQSNTPSDQNVTREKPSQSAEPSTEANPSTMPQTQNPSPNYDQNQNTSDQTQSTTTEKNTGSTGTSDQNAANNENMPRTAGELPLIALIGLLSLGAAAGTSVLSRAKSR